MVKKSKNKIKQSSKTIKLKEETDGNTIKTNDSVTNNDIPAAEDNIKEKKGKKGGKKGSKKLAKKLEQEKLREEQSRKEEKRKKEKAEAKLKQKLHKEKLLKELQENDIRHDILQKSCQMLGEVLLGKMQREAALRSNEEWESFLKCDGTPDPNNVAEMNYYLYQWEIEPDPMSLEETLPKIEIVMKLISTLNDYVLNPINASKSTITLWKFMRHRFYEELFNKLNKLTFNMMLNIRQSLEPISLVAGRIEKHSDYFAIGLYSRYYDISPCIGENDDDVGLPVVVEFPEMKISITVPYQIVYEKYIIRIFWSKYDDFSILTKTYEVEPMPEEYCRDLFQFNHDEFEMNQRLQLEYNEEIKSKVKRKMHKDREVKQSKQLEPKEEVLPSDTESSLTIESISPSQEFEPEEPDIESRSSDISQQSVLPVVIEPKGTKSPSEIMLLVEEENKKSLAIYLKQRIQGGTILNLRKYRPIGGIIHVGFYEAIPQPYTLPDNSHVQIIFGDRNLKPMNINMNTNLIIKRIFNKYRNKLGYIHPRNEPKNNKSKVMDDKERIANSLGKLSIVIETRLSGGKINPSEAQVMQQEEPNQKDTVVLSDLSSRIDLAESNDRKLSSSTRRSTGSRQSIRSDITSVNSIDYVKPEETQEVEDEQSRLEGSEESEGSYDSGGSMFDEYCFNTYEACNFKPRIKIALPKHVLWFEKPFPIIWSQKASAWYYNDSRMLFDIKYEENEDGTLDNISFRYTRIESPLALAIKRYYPLPFTRWQIKPNFSKWPVENIIFSLETEFVSVEFLIGANTLCINSIDIRLPNQNQHLIDNEIGKLYKPATLMRKLMRIGIDIFPSHDTYLYLKCATPKHYICEQHTYKCMALACSTFNFLSSKWNHLTSNKNIVLNMMECIGCDFKSEYRLVLVTPYRAVTLNQVESGMDFPENIEEIPFYPDLYWLIQEHSCTISKNRINEVNKKIADTVYYMLEKTKIFSYS